MLKRIIVVILSAALSMCFASCSDKSVTETDTAHDSVNSITYKPVTKASEDEPKKIIIDINNELIGESDDVEIDYLNEVEGYWVRPEGYIYIETDKLVPDELIINSATGKWKPYRDGAFDEEYNCQADVNGLELTLEDGSKMVYATNGCDLLNNDGSVAYVRVDSISQ